MMNDALYVAMVSYFPDGALVLTDEVYEDLDAAKAACIERLHQTRFGEAFIAARWWDAGVVSNFTDDDGHRYATIYRREVRRKGR